MANARFTILTDNLLANLNLEGNQPSNLDKHHLVASELVLSVPYQFQVKTLSLASAILPLIEQIRYSAPCRAGMLPDLSAERDNSKDSLLEVHPSEATVDVALLLQAHKECLTAVVANPKADVPGTCSLPQLLMN